MSICSLSKLFSAKLIVDVHAFISINNLNWIFVALVINYTLIDLVIKEIIAVHLEAKKCF